MTDVLDVMIDVAAEASAVVLEVYETPFSVDFKAPKDPVTEADRRANELICARLAEAFPDIPIVAEESAPDTYARFRSASRVFFVDPVDGTAEFVKRNGEFAVMIGLLEGDRASCGVVHAPVRGEVYAGRVGQGAFCIQNGTRTPIRVSDTEALARSTLVASRSHRTEDLDKALEILGAERWVALGSAGLKGIEVARGGADAYVAPGRSGKRWDSCAADAIVSAAGGRFGDGWGEPLDYRAESLANDRGIVATNAAIFDQVLERLERFRSAHGSPG